VDIYERRTGLDRQRIIDMMNAETWLSATEAQTLGFCDEVIGRVTLAAKISRFDLKSWPLNDPDFNNDIKNAKDFERVLRELGLSKSQASALTAKAKSIGSQQSESDHIALANRLQQLNARLQKPLLN
jgi:hypothetical protein